MISMRFYLWLLFVLIFEILGDYFCKRWAVDRKAWQLGTGGALYLVATLGWATTLLYETLSRAIIYFVAANLIAVVLVGVLVFHEVLTGRTWLGLACALAALILLES